MTLLTDIFAIVSSAVSNMTHDIWGRFVTGCMERVGDLHSELATSDLSTSDRRVAEHGLGVTLRVLRQFLHSVEDPNTKFRGTPQVVVSVCMATLQREYKTVQVKLPKTATIAHLRVEVGAKLGVASNLVGVE